MRISDWSSDVCSSDLAWVFGGARRGIVSAIERRSEIAPGEARAARRQRQRIEPMLDRQSVVSGKSVSVRVDLGGRRIIKKKQRHNMTQHRTMIKIRQRSYK